jgi:hypothetical protein
VKYNAFEVDLINLKEKQLSKTDLSTIFRHCYLLLLIVCASQVCIFSTAFSVLRPSHRAESAGKQTEPPPCVRWIDRIYLWFGLDIECSPRVILRQRSHGEVVECQLVGISWWRQGLSDEESGQFVGVAWWAILVSKFIVIYPAVDGISNFVLCAVAIGEITTGPGTAINSQLRTQLEKTIILPSCRFNSTACWCGVC